MLYIILIITVTYYQYLHFFIKFNRRWYTLASPSSTAKKLTYISFYFIVFLIGIKKESPQNWDEADRWHGLRVTRWELRACSPSVWRVAWCEVRACPPLVWRSNNFGGITDISLIVLLIIKKSKIMLLRLKYQFNYVVTI